MWLTGSPDTAAPPPPPPSLQHKGLQGPEEKKELQPRWVRCCSNTCAQDQFQLADRALGRREHSSMPSYSQKETEHPAQPPPSVPQPAPHHSSRAGTEVDVLSPTSAISCTLWEHHIHLVWPTLLSHPDPDQTETSTCHSFIVHETQHHLTSLVKSRIAPHTVTWDLPSSGSS